jgi:NAD(P)-dependent dehydrogenase (short-subunit alcohol dehydrogenase family)
VNSEEVNVFMENLKLINHKAIFISCDVSSYIQVAAALELVVKEFGTIDVALNNAGVAGEASKVGDMAEATWSEVIGVNLNGVFNCMKHELFYMAKQKKGVVINVSSILGKVGYMSLAPYVAAKHGVIGLTKTAALEYAYVGIRINAICPGFIQTPLLDKAGICDYSNVKQHIIEKHPLNRLGTAEEVAKTFLFLASDDSSFITGSTIEVDGGYLAQ